MNNSPISRNDPCPCGSGRKFKKCCYSRARVISKFDREMAIDVVEQYVAESRNHAAARNMFYGDLELEGTAIDDHFREASESAFLFWFAFDYRLDDGSYLVDRALKESPLLSQGERCYLEQLRGTAIMVYEVIATRPGESILLRRLDNQEEIEVRERTASVTMKRWDVLLTRLNPVGPSGGPEIEMGAMLIPPMVRDEIKEVLDSELHDRAGGEDDVQQFKKLGPLFHQIWLETIVAPRIPTIVTAEGDPIVAVTTRFDVLDAERARSAFDAEPELQREEESDSWSYVAGESLLGTIRMEGSHLTLETHSEPRADRGRQLLERIAGDAIAYRCCEKVDVRERTKQALQDGQWPEAPPNAEDELPLEIQDQLIQAHMAKFSRQWLDDHIPALDQRTPRVAAQSAKLRPRLIGLLKDIENDYLRALADGRPAFDPTWMWDELGLSDDRDAPRVRHPLWLAHESMEQHLPGITQFIRSVTDGRSVGETDPLRTAVTRDELQADPQLQELIRNGAGRLQPHELLNHLEFYCNYDIHRRKTFWVDESLAWMLANTQVDAESALFRLPFPSYVLVYTDRHTLGIAERALATHRDCPLRGHMLAVVCAYVYELQPDSSRVRLGLTFDALAGQRPHLMNWELHIDRHGTLEGVVDDSLAGAQTNAGAMFRPLLNAAINATLYTISAGVKMPQYRVQQPKRDVPRDCLEADEVYYLPGKIKISHLRKLQEVERGPTVARSCTDSWSAGTGDAPTRTGKINRPAGSNRIGAVPAWPALSNVSIGCPRNVTACDEDRQKLPPKSRGVHSMMKYAVADEVMTIGRPQRVPIHRPQELGRGGRGRFLIIFDREGDSPYISNRRPVIAVFRISLGCQACPTGRPR